jgi:hypothetical protein
LFHKKAGTGAGQPGSRSGHGQILTWAAAADDIHGRKLGATQLRNIPDVNHVREPQLRYLNGEDFDLARPYRHDAIADCRQWEASDPIEKASHRQHNLHPHGAEGMPFRKRPFSFCHFLCRHIFYGYAEFLGGVDLTLHTAGYRIAENPQLVTVSQRLFTHVETEPSVVGVMFVQHLRIQQMRCKKSVPFVHHEPARIPCKFRISFNVPDIGGRYINELHVSSIYFGAA